MSEFPEWLEQRQGPFWHPSYKEAQALHAELAIVYKLVPEIDELLTTRPNRAWPWWKRYLWYVKHT